MEKMISVSEFREAVDETVATLAEAVRLSTDADPVKVEILTGVSFGLKFLAQAVERVAR